MLSYRLKTISNFVNFNDNVADIGCDHGFVLIELFKQNPNRMLLGIENKEGPYKTFVKNLKLNKCFDKIKHSLSDGLKEVDNTYNCVILAGMGTDNIIKIINNNKEKIENINNFIIDSHTNSKELRSFMCDLGYKVSREKFLVEDKIAYTIILFEKGSEKYSDLELIYGPVVLKEKEEEFIEFYTKKRKYLENKAKTITNKQFLSNLEEEIKEIEEIINEY